MSDAESSKSNDRSNSVPLNLEVFATNQELIERVTQEIHSPWKWIPIIMYLTSAMLGYAASILFYLFWEHVFGGNCPLWASVEPPVHVRSMRSMDGSLVNGNNNNNGDFNDDWRSKVIITFLHKGHCQYFHFICLCSCSFGIIWCMLFAKCASGIFGAQWLILPPVLIFQIIFTIVIYLSVYDYYHGYDSMTAGLKIVAAKYMNLTELVKFTNDCELVSYYLEIHKFYSHNLCDTQGNLEFTITLMAWSWVAGLSFLILRVIVVNDFRLLRTVVYKIHKSEISLNENETLEEINFIRSDARARRKNRKKSKKLTFLFAQT
ncbi:uncharacterized protein LOC130676504 [Microplitis mediator]|uniref:uncharacterized protein LOC130676504 n=1 Tax=Microplitis mediator TaxID=375433 RepID=UPI002553A55C|nr:uncharacterized protein LOC130676504 [Microplitis mediator]